MKRKWKWLLLLLLIPAVPLLFFAWKLFYPPAFLPHQKIIIRVPYEFTDPPTGIIPMGETIYHPKPKVPHGHPGIDFGWTTGEKHVMLASTDGVLVSAKQGASEPGKWDIEIQAGVYLLRYKEMDDYSGLKVGSSIKEGDTVGHAGRYCDQQHCWFNIHWELASASTILDRFCPVNYFDSQSKTSIENIWVKVPADDKIKSKFPDLCSGDYNAKEEK